MKRDIHIKKNGEQVTILITLGSEKYSFDIPIESMLTVLGLDEGKCATDWKPINPATKRGSKQIDSDMP